MSGIAMGRLREERKDWRRNHPVGFWAKPDTLADGSMNMFNWTAGIPGKKNTDWEGGVYKVIMEFPEDYPARPPKCKTYKFNVEATRFVLDSPLVSSCFFSFASSPPRVQQANLHPRSSIPTCIPPEPFVCRFSMKKKVGVRALTFDKF
jgi:hypothetical protein